MTKQTIYGENATSLAAIMEYIQLPNHPFHAEAVVKANAFVEAEREVRAKRGRQDMQNQMHNISEEEWSRIVD